MQSEQQAGTLLAGAVKRPITPTVKGRTVLIAGYQTGRLATDIHDELWARAMAMRLGHITFVLVVLDLIGLFREDVESIQEQALEEGLSAENLVVLCTRNHAGPDTLGLWNKGPLARKLNIRYMRFLRQEIVQVIRLALSAMEPAQAYLARSEAIDLTNDGLSRELAVLQLRTSTGKTIATLVNSPLIPKVLDGTNKAISADFPDGLYHALEQSPDHVAMYACAGMSEQISNVVQERSWKEAERLGHQLAATVERALDGAKPTLIGELNVWQTEITIPPDSYAARQSARGNTLRDPWLTEWRTRSKVGIIQLGPARAAILPGLVPSGLGSEIRRILDAPIRFLLCVSNDNLGLIPSRGPLPSPLVTRLPVDLAKREVLIGSHASTIIRDELSNLIVKMHASRHQEDVPGSTWVPERSIATSAE